MFRLVSIFLSLLALLCEVSIHTQHTHSTKREHIQGWVRMKAASGLSKNIINHEDIVRLRSEGRVSRGMEKGG